MGMAGAGSASSGSASKAALEAIGYHYGTGAVIAVIGSVALGLLLAMAPARAQAGSAVRARRRLGSRHPAAHA